MNLSRRLGSLTILILIVLFIWILPYYLSLFFSTDEKVEYQVLSIPLDIHLVSSPNSNVDLTEADLRAVLTQTNQIWAPYGIEFFIKNVRSIDVTDELSIIGTRSGNAEADAKALGAVIGTSLYDKTIDAFLVERFITRGGSDEGVGLNSGNISAAFVKAKPANRLDWNLAHELGHSINLNHSGVNNLMVDGSCWTRPFHPPFIRRDQVETSRNKIMGKEHSTKANWVSVAKFDIMPPWLACAPGEFLLFLSLVQISMALTAVIISRYERRKETRENFSRALSGSGYC